MDLSPQMTNVREEIRRLGLFRFSVHRRGFFSAALCPTLRDHA
jgi:hypothetical protein